jgi:hypothetical protein
VYTLWNGNDFDGTDIEATWMTKTLYGVTPQAQPALTNTKRWRWVDFLFETDNTTTLTIEWLEGNAGDDGAAFSSTTFDPDTATLVSADGDTLLSASGDSLLAALVSSQLRVPLADSNGDYLHDEGVRLRIGDNASNGSWSLEAFALAYQILPGLKRRFQ